MAISFIGGAATEATTITIPAGHRNGDIIIIFAFRAAVTAPTLASGYTNLGTSSSGLSSHRVGYKIARSAAETSGTWTNASGLVCLVYRGIATNRTPIIYGTVTTGTGTTVTYPTKALTQSGTSWMVGMAATKATTSTLETPPTDMTNRTNTAGALAEYAGHDTDGAYTAGQGTWPATAVAVGGVSSEWRAITLEILAEQGVSNNYQGVDAGDGMSTGEKIR